MYSKSSCDNAHGIRAWFRCERYFQICYQQNLPSCMEFINSNDQLIIAVNPLVLGPKTITVSHMLCKVPCWMYREHCRWIWLHRRAFPLPKTVWLRIVLCHRARRSSATWTVMCNELNRKSPVLQLGIVQYSATYQCVVKHSGLLCSTQSTPVQHFKEYPALQF